MYDKVLPNKLLVDIVIYVNCVSPPRGSDTTFSNTCIGNKVT